MLKTISKNLLSKEKSKKCFTKETTSRKHQMCFKSRPNGDKIQTSRRAQENRGFSMARTRHIKTGATCPCPTDGQITVVFNALLETNFTFIKSYSFEFIKWQLNFNMPSPNRPFYYDFSAISRRSRWSEFWLIPMTGCFRMNF